MYDFPSILHTCMVGIYHQHVYGLSELRYP